MDYQHNFPKISNNFTRYDPNSQLDRNNKQGNNVEQGNARPPISHQQGQNTSNMLNRTRLVNLLHTL